MMNFTKKPSLRGALDLGKALTPSPATTRFIRTGRI
jgi:hypothetical protein